MKHAIVSVMALTLSPAAGWSLPAAAGLTLTAAIVLLPSPASAQPGSRASAVGAHIGAALSGYAALEGNGIAAVYEGSYDRALAARAALRVSAGTGRYDAADPDDRGYTRIAGEVMVQHRSGRMRRYAGAGVGAYVLTARAGTDPPQGASVTGVKPGFTVFAGADRFISERWALQFEGRVQRVPWSVFAASVIGSIGIKRYWT